MDPELEHGVNPPSRAGLELLEARDLLRPEDQGLLREGVRPQAEGHADLG